MSKFGVTAIIPCYNGERYIGQAIESVLNQSYGGPLEILVCDDGSTDRSVEIARLFGLPVAVLQQPNGINRGVSAARNLGIRAATQQLIAFLDCDDFWSPDHLAALVSAYEADPTAGLLYDNGQYTDEDGRVFGFRHNEEHRAIEADNLLLDCCLAVNGIVVPKVIFDHVGLFDESLRYAEDHDMWLRILERYSSKYVPKIGYYYRMHGSQTIHNGEMLWHHAALVLERASQRFSYSRSVIRKRSAVINYHLAASALHRGRLVRALCHIANAAVKDPVRSARAGLNILRKSALPRIRGCRT